jgi:hypothetical protein
MTDPTDYLLISEKPDCLKLDLVFNQTYEILHCKTHPILLMTKFLHIN